MSKSIHKGTELNNVKETWDQNEREQVNRNAPSTTEENLERVIEEESSEYDEANKEERLLSGDRASVNDEDALSE
jgi:rubrerythrin